MSFARLTLLGTFAAAGVALALCLGLSPGSPPENRQAFAQTPPAPPEVTPPIAVSPDVKDEKEKAVVPAPTALSQPDLVETRPAPPLTAPSGTGFQPVKKHGQDGRATSSDTQSPPALAPLPATAPMPGHVRTPTPLAQSAEPPAPARLFKVFDYLAERLAPGTPAEQVPAPLPTRQSEPKPRPSRPAPAPAAVKPPVELPIELPVETSSEPSVRRSDAGEGDGRLRMQFNKSDIREVLDALAAAGNLNILAGNSVQGTVSATLNGVDVDSALDAILKSTGFVARRESNFIYVGTPKDFENLEQSLDTIGTRVYRPNYVTAAELQTLVLPLLTAGVGVVSVSTPADEGIAADSGQVGGNGYAGSDVVLVRDYEAVLAGVDQVVAEVDVRPLQVAIEAMILSVKLTDGMDFGVDFELLRNKEHAKLGWGEVPSHQADAVTLNDQIDVPTGAIIKGATTTVLNGGLKFGFLDESLGVFLNALESIADTSVIATPRLMVLNKHRAEILIGEELGYVSTTITETSSTQSVQFLEVGAQLRLRPFVSSDGMIRMEIHPELSTGFVDTESGFTLPNKETTQVTTNIMVGDGSTVVIGGLMRDELKSTATQVPLFGSLPVVGVAFRSKHETTERREIIVLITPHIVGDCQNAAEGAVEQAAYSRRQNTYAEQMSPLSREHISRRYFRMAQQAWAAGNRRVAARYADMAVHFNPLNRAAIDLRANICGADGGAPPVFDGLPPMIGPAAEPGGWGEHAQAPPFDGAEIAPWALEDLQRPLDPHVPAVPTEIVRPQRLQ